MTGTPIDWPARQEELRPPTLSTDQWAAIYGNLTDELPTTKEYVHMLNENAKYLARLGQTVNNVDDLWNFEVQQAYGFTAVPTLDSVVDASMPSPGVSLQFSRSYSNSVYSHYVTGPLGYGWSLAWQSKLVSQNGGNLIQIVGQDGSARTSRKTPATANTTAVSATVPASSRWAVASSNCDLLAAPARFRADGKIDYVSDKDSDRVTAGYDAGGRLMTLIHSSGATLTLAYNAAGRIASITDSVGRATTYGYDATNSYLITVTTADGKVTHYTYQSSGTVQEKHALLSIERGGTTQFFTYDSRGRLDTSRLTGNARLSRLRL